MAYYLGFYRSGKVKVFQTAKAVTKKSFPFYAKVMGPFEDEEAAREEAERHSGRLGVGLSYPRERQIRRRLERNPGLESQKCRCGHPKEAHAEGSLRKFEGPEGWFEGRSCKLCSCLEFKWHKPPQPAWAKLLDPLCEACGYAFERDPGDTSERKGTLCQRCKRKRSKKNPGEVWHTKMVQGVRKTLQKIGRPPTDDELGFIDAHQYSAERSRELGLNPRHRNPGRGWLIYRVTGIRGGAEDEILRLREEGKDARVTFNPNSRKWEVWCREVKGNPAKLDRFRPFHGGIPATCGCGHSSGAHYKRRSSRTLLDCKLCDCNKYITSRSRREVLRRNPPGYKIYDNILAIEARKGKDSLWPQENFRHDFKGGATVEGMPDGSLRVKSKNGKRLWKNFDYD